MNSVEIFEVFPWNKNLETGIDKIDEQHKELVKLLNLLASHIAKRSNIKLLNDVLDRLGDYADYHFKSEEDIWSNYLVKDELFSKHKETHNSFVEKINIFFQQKNIKSEHDIIEDILKFLIGWLAMHILDSDKRMAIIVNQINQGKTLEESKRDADIQMSGVQGLLIGSILEMYESVSTRTLELLKERTERENLEKKLKQSQENEKLFADAVMSSVPGLIALYNEKAQLVRWNKNHINELGYTNEELKHKNILDFIENEDKEKVIEAIKSVHDKGYAKIEHNILKKDGESIPYLLNGVNLKFENKDYLLITGANISSLKQTEFELRKALVGIIAAVSKAMVARDPYTAGHQERVSKISGTIAEYMGMSDHQIEGLRLGANIHDIGKLSIPSELLTKPTHLSQLEYEMIKTHAAAGATIMKDVKFPWPILEIVSQHHEKIDGSGYPLGLTGDQMAIEAKIVAVADVFEAMSSHRPYRPSLGVEVALDELKKNSGKLYDAKVVKALIDILDKNPNAFE